MSFSSSAARLRLSSLPSARLRLGRFLNTSSSSSATITPLYPHSPQYTYSLGLSYASKSSPPFLQPGEKPKPYGFLNKDTDLGRWVGNMMDLEAGRGELSSSSAGGWSEGVREEVRRWGAGEDFFAIERAKGDLHIALSDGVGGWGDRVDPSLFSQSLCYHYALSARSLAAQSTESVDPQDVLRKGYKAVLGDKAVSAGGGTLVGMRLDEEGGGRFVNLGDSGYAIIRNDQVKYISKPQTHFFNCPVQLSKVPSSMRQMGIIHDSPDSADVESHELEIGDMVVLFTDGLSDNLPVQHLPLLSSALTRVLDSPNNTHLSPAERDAERARLFADMLVGYGRMAMARTGEEDGGKGWKTPFEIEAKKMMPQWGWKGGKIDDITVITAVVAEKD
ncbi:hypothetical protein CI109_103758 [Kwoniella shandongensis]|uniref:Protein phosphatase n=1 Tax=Kwoniella shandongensis TaxID=1734106 RepID=A0A5M6C7M3_9TREE|nr:uncharacterized protein CI109_000545 [Kwoniella shandongensis]KAA5530973.1 hypothetical protein CI109_000545 [Kwoniella shandongensis]